MNPYDVPEFQPGVDFRICWLHGFYDGPTSGLCEHEGRAHWFETVNEWARKRWYLAYPLTDDEAADEEMRHSYFRRLVGSHMDSVDGTFRRIGQVDGEDWERFYATRDQWPEQDYTKRPAVFGFYRVPSPHRRRARSRRYWDRRTEDS